MNSKPLRSVLLIDDNSADNYFHKHVLESNHITESVQVITAADNALEYLESSNELPPDLIFLDINMPRMDGFEFLSEYRGRIQTKKVSAIIIMLSTSVSPEEKNRALSLGASGFIEKPLTPDKVNEILKIHFSQ